ncbi:polyketide synthase [Marinobacter zhejiangensis]|uniref:Amino acid adenylation domain-containing protein n=1 Tax=Marinobacter zhejiangensis TaxID=488535 RepID=A0A1I4RNV2_9GAMM|nr:polyketide synthase [Marinobacter zhejiangensis]SFM53927.1 amino acid adenylation domain-containing protein [Marinobacter zhejiangensis]
MSASKSCPEFTGFLSLFDRAALTFSDSPALWTQGELITYATLDNNARLIQAQIAELGTDPGVPIAIHAHDRALAIAAMIAILRHGSPYLPLDPIYPSERLSYMVSHAKAELTVSDNDAFLSPIGAHLDLRTLVPGNTPPNHTGTNQQRTRPITADTDAYVIYTSGSTGTPKGVLMNHGTLDNLIHWQNKRYQEGVRLRTLQFSALSFDVSFQEIFSTLTQGGTLYLIDNELKQDFRQLLEFIEAHAIERIFLPYIALLQLVMWANRLERYPTTLKEVITAGEQLVVSNELRVAFNAMKGVTLFNQYGPCETHVVSEFQLDWPADRWPTLPPIGAAIDQAQLLVLDEQMHAVKGNDVGELYIAGPVLAHGYINSPEQTEQRFITLSGGSEKRAYRTGDLASFDDHGQLLYHGRIDNQVKINGYRVELSEVEAQLLDTGLVGEAAAAVQEQGGVKRLVAFVTTKASSSDLDVALKDALKAAVPGYMIPTRFFRVAHLSKTPSGKIDRKSMLEALSKEPGHQEVASEDLSLTLFGIIQKELDHPGLSTEDSLQDQGMDSLAANRIAAAFYSQARVSIPVYSLFQYRTLAQFLDYATSRQALPSAKPSQGGTEGNLTSRTKDVAIIGMSLRVPGADSLEAFWQNLLDGKESVTFFEPTDTQAGTVNARGVLDGDPFGFDAGFFGISPIEAEFIDPQQRLLLELAWHALENAGYDPEQFAGKIGVYCGVGNNTYYLNNVLKNAEKLEDYGPLQAMVANEKDYAATRLAHKLNLVGPALSIHTACSTSLVAVAEAVEAIRQGKCDIAIAGGASLTFPQQQPHTHQEGSIYTRDGHTRPFDKNSSGTVFSDGGGVVVLKRLDNALTDQDYVYATICGAAINNDGAEKGSFSGPSVQGQKSVILAAIRDAGINADRVGYVEAHGTATPIGDPIEVSALTEAFAEYSDAHQFCKLGSVKGNFGHLTAAAGVVGLIKSALAIDHGVIPPSINFDEPNPELNLDQSPFSIAQQATPWQHPKPERIAGVSSFGIGGTNAHILLKGIELPALNAKTTSPGWVPLCFSANTPEALAELLNDYKDLLERPRAGLAPGELASELVRNRRNFRYRQTLPQNAVSADLADLADEAEDTEPCFVSPSVALAFPGQGSQVSGMGRAQYDAMPAFKTAFDACAEILQSEHDCDIRFLVFESGDPLKDTQKTQISLFCVGYAMSAVLKQLGLKPQAAIGHSIGELVAATVAGVFDLATAIRVVMTRGAVMQAQPSGSMLAVRANLERINPLLPEGVVIAAENTADSLTLSGPHDVIQAFQKTLDDHDVKFRSLNTSHAFHSPAMDAACEAFAERLADADLNPPKFKFISCVTGDWISEQQATDIRYWASQIRQPVQFRKGCETLGSLKNLILLECGPQGTVCGMAMQNLDEKTDIAAIPLLAEAGNPEQDLRSTSQGLGKAWSCGVNLDWPCGTPNSSLRVTLPGYPFQHRHYAIEADNFAAVAVSGSTPATHFMAAAVPVADAPSGAPMKDVILEKLRSLFSDISGIDLSKADANATFFELGLDSLLLTQSTVKLKKKFKVNITFRQLLNDCGNLAKLADYLVKEGGADTLPSPTQPLHSDVTTAPQAAATRAPSVPQSPPAAPNTGAGLPPMGDIQLLLQQQMQVLQGQLALLSGMSSAQALAGATPVSAPEGSKTGHGNTTEQSGTQLKPFGAGARINVKRSNDMSARQKDNFKKLATRYNARFSASKSFAQENRKHLADPRVVSGFRPVIKEVIYPIVVERSEGPYLWDIDGGKLIDVTCGFGSNFFGNSAPFIKEAIAQQLNTGYEIGPQHPLAAKAARLFCQVTGNERVAFCNTGSEAVLGAMRLARTVTAREKVVIFENDYHGIHDDVIITRGSNGYAVPAAAGIPDSAADNMIVLDYGSDESLEYIREHAEDIAAVLVEPVQSRNPDLQPRDFLQKARALCSDHQIALIFDEVITGFRIHPRGAQGFYGVDADICTYGKIVGGGLPIGAISGKAQYLDALDGGQWQFGDESAPEVGVTYFAGTFVRHPLAMAAAVAVLARLADNPNLQDELNQRADAMVSEINQHAQLVGAPLKIEHCGSMCKVKIPQDIAFEELIYVILREKGIHIWDARPMFITLAHSEDDIQAIVQAFKDAMDDMISMDFFPATSDSSHTPTQKPPVEGARLGRDEAGKAAWYVPSKTDKDQFEKWVG